MTDFELGDRVRVWSGVALDISSIGSVTHLASSIVRVAKDDGRSPMWHWVGHVEHVDAITRLSELVSADPESDTHG